MRCCSWQNSSHQAFKRVRYPAAGQGVMSHNNMLRHCRASYRTCANHSFENFPLSQLFDSNGSLPIDLRLGRTTAPATMHRLVHGAWQRHDHGGMTGRGGQGYLSAALQGQAVFCSCPCAAPGGCARGGPVSRILHIERDSLVPPFNSLTTRRPIRSG